MHLDIKIQLYTAEYFASIVLQASQLEKHYTTRSKMYA